jgi:ABC-type polysaccharide/polyol phosphate transport system ATPase subunit
MSVPIDVRLQAVGKQYRKGTGRSAEQFWALRDVSIDVPRGTSTGVIGRNGAGKSTLLKLLAGITAPTTGRIVIDGRLAALIEVGSGFHPELTGRENIMLSGAILGMRRRELLRRLTSIVDFAGVSGFIDTPVKWYSSGMYVRLGFAIAAHLAPDILLVDEVLAVGDAEFQGKCLQRIEELKAQGCTTIVISHDLTAIERLCDTAVLLEHGAVSSVGPPVDVVARYHRQLIRDEADGKPDYGLIDNSPVHVTTLGFRDEQGREPVAFRVGQPFTAVLRYACTRPADEVAVELSYYSTDGRTRVASFRTDDAGHGLNVQPPGGRIEFACDALPLPPGVYYVDAVMRDRRSGHAIDWWDGGTLLYVDAGRTASGAFQMPHTFRVVHGVAEDRASSVPSLPSSSIVSSFRR